MSEAEFRSTLDPVAIVQHRATVGGPQPAEMQRMLKEARDRLAAQDAWIQARRKHIHDSLAELDKQFDQLVASGQGRERRTPGVRHTVPPGAGGHTTWPGRGPGHTGSVGFAAKAN